MRKSRFGRALILGLLVWLPATGDYARAAEPKTRNVVLIVTDGLRWQEVFQGPDQALFDRQHGGVRKVEALRKDFWRATPGEGRQTLLPFFWTVIARQGQLYGNQVIGSVAQVTNGLKFSYPGYNEMLSGHADARINSNDFGPNPNVTVLEYLNRLPEFRGRAVAFGTWNVFSAIFNKQRSGLPVRAGWEYAANAEPPGPKQPLMLELYRTTTRIWDDVIYDSFMQAEVKEYVESKHPRVMFIGYGETDEWAHAGRYDLLLRSAHQFDAFVADLWNTMQAMPEYRGQTTFVLTTDHGRGSGREKWKHHGRKIKGAENIWIAVIGPDTPPLGERRNAPLVTQNQIAATVAALLGQDYRREVPAAAPPLSESLPAK